MVGAIQILESSGLFESAYCTWSSLDGAVGYNVYEQKVGDSAWTKIDTELIRKYPSYWRADALGLPAGQYRLKVTPVDASGLVDSSSSITSNLTVKGYHRDGFAFKGGTASGAYNADGSLKDKAIVLYVTNDTADTITYSIQTSSKGTMTSATSIQSILTLLKKGTETRAVDVRFIGNIKTPSSFANSDNSSICKGDLVVDCSSKYNVGVTVEGVGNDTVANGWGIRVKGGINVEIRNIGFMNCSSDETDNIGLQQDNEHIWVHHCDMFYGNAGSDEDQVKGDGALDCKKSNYVTLSYNHFWDNGKCNLLGLNEKSSDLYITYDHNWYDHSDSRHPRCRYYNAHVYNNYYDGNAKYGVGACLASSVFVEKNYFRYCKDPMMTSMQGTDLIGANANKGDGTFSNENGGAIKAYANAFAEGSYASYLPYKSDGSSPASTYGYDCYEVASREETVPSTYVAKQGSAVYRNWDTDASLVDTYTADAAENVPNVVTSSAGRMQQGDFQWTFDNATEDKNYLVIAALKTAVTNYAGTLVSVGGNSL